MKAIAVAMLVSATLALGACEPEKQATQQGNQAAQQGATSACDRLVAFFEAKGVPAAAAPLTLEKAREWRASKDGSSCENATVNLAAAGVQVPAQ